MLLKMRSQAIRQHTERIHAALWRYTSSEMVEIVRSEAAAQHEDLVTEIESGALFTPEVLRLRLGDLGRAQAQDLAAALWATELCDARAAELFRLLPALVDTTHEVSESTNAAPIPADTPPPEKRRHRERRLALKDDVSRLEGELTDARQQTRDRAQQLADANRQLESSRQQAEVLARRVKDLESEVQTELGHRRATDAKLAEAQRGLKQSVVTSESYRTDLERAEAELSEAETERTGLLTQLASAQSRLQEINAQLRAIPRDKEAIRDWLEREEDRLRILEDTVEGGARERVIEEKRLRRKLELAFLEAYPQFKQERPSVARVPRPLSFQALGGGGEVGRSAYLITVGSINVLFDCGIAVGARDPEDEVPNLSNVHRLDALLLTHSHTDHVGWTPALVAAIDYFPIYCTAPTAALLPVMLHDSRTHYVRALAEEQLKRTFDPTAPPATEAYRSDHILETEKRILQARVGEKIGIASTELTATFFPAGHILGAASVLLEGGGRRVIVSGDISADHQFTVGAFSVPPDLGDIDLLVLESTYGDRRRDPADVAESELVEFVARTVPQGIALLPCFALGRAQEVIAILTQARRAGRLPGGLRIVVDGMINKINPIYVEHAKLEPEEFIEVGSQLDRDLIISEATDSDSEPTVVVTTSGMLMGGPVIEWARRLLPNPRHRMALLGYQDEGAPGGVLRRLTNGRPPYKVTLMDQEGERLTVTVAAPVANIPLSSHADQDGLVQYAAAIRPRRIVLVHGDDDARTGLRSRLLGDAICGQVELSQSLQIP